MTLGRRQNKCTNYRTSTSSIHRFALHLRVSVQKRFLDRLLILEINNNNKSFTEDEEAQNEQRKVFPPTTGFAEFSSRCNWRCSRLVIKSTAAVPPWLKRKVAIAYVCVCRGGERKTKLKKSSINKRSCVANTHTRKRKCLKEKSLWSRWAVLYVLYVSADPS